MQSDQGVCSMMDAFEAPSCVDQLLTDLAGLKAGRQSRRYTEEAAIDLAAERAALKIDEARRALQIRQGRGVFTLRPIKFGAGLQLQPDQIDQSARMRAHASEQVGDVAGQVVDDLAARAKPPAEEDAAHAHEGLDVEGVRRRLDPGGEATRQIALAADIGGDRLCGIDGRQPCPMGVMPTPGIASHDARSVLRPLSWRSG